MAEPPMGDRIHRPNRQHGLTSAVQVIKMSGIHGALAHSNRIILRLCFDGMVGLEEGDRGRYIVPRQ